MQPRQMYQVRLYVACMAVATAGPPLHAVEVQLLPGQDAFARESEPTRNFGAAGALAVAGAAAVNGANEPQGQYQSILQFDASMATAAFDAQLGADNWQLTGASLLISQIAAPPNPIFNIGAGSISIQWISDDNWLEGTGTPMDPPIDGGGNEITWNFLQTLVAGASTSVLAVHPVEVQSGPVSIPLTLTSSFASDIVGSGFISLFAAPQTTTVGFTYFASEFTPDPSLQAKLVLTAEPLTDSDGDLNCDNAVSLLDVQPFALALTDPAAWDNMFPCEITRADVNDDGQVDGRDVAAFADLLINP